jgi:UDP-N-acetylglucosamine 3-dehydrogenase
MTKIGIMSFAHMHAHSYAASLNRLPGVELAAIWDDDVKRGKSMAKEFGAPFVKEMDKFLAGGLNGVIVTSENESIAPWWKRRRLPDSGYCVKSRWRPT